MSADFGEDIVNGIVSLESDARPNFELGVEAYSAESQRGVCDKVAIEDISSDEEVDKM